MNFESAAEIVRSGTFQTSNEEKLMLYALFKIVTVGQRPDTVRNVLNPVEAAKWDAWNSFGTEYNQSQARMIYPLLVSKLQSRAGEM